MRYGAAAAQAPEIEMNGVDRRRVNEAVAGAGGSVRYSEGGWYWVQK
jgi:hypothetical protein